MGGFVSVINAMKTICDDLGVKFKFNFDVENVEIKNNKISLSFLVIVNLVQKL